MREGDILRYEAARRHLPAHSLRAVISPAPELEEPRTLSHMYKTVLIILFRMSNDRPKQSGFTLIELMVVIAILAVVASLALVSYSNYLDNSRTAVVLANYESAVDIARGNYVVARQRSTLGASINDVIPGSAAGWTNMLNTIGSGAPGGGEAYAVGTGSTVTGAVGIEFAGDYSSATSVVTIHRPAYMGIPASTEVISQASF